MFYFLQSQIIPTLREAGVGVVVLTEDQSVELISERYAAPGLVVEGLRLDQVQRYTRTVSPQPNGGWIFCGAPELLQAPTWRWSTIIFAR